MRERGVITRVKGECIFFAPPLVTTEEQIDKIIDATGDAIDAVVAEAGGA